MAQIEYKSEFFMTAGTLVNNVYTRITKKQTCCFHDVYIYWRALREISRALGIQVASTIELKNATASKHIAFRPVTRVFLAVVTCTFMALTVHKGNLFMTTDTVVHTQYKYY